MWRDDTPNGGDCPERNPPRGGRGPSLALSGRLDPASDSGLSDDDGITFVTRPIFDGTTVAGALVSLCAQPLGSASSVIIGTTVADSHGNWSVTSSTLADGRSTITATAIDQASGLQSTIMMLPNPAEGYVTIDTQAPRIDALSISPRDGEILITFQDNLSGLAEPTASNSQNYFLRRAFAPITGENQRFDLANHGLRRSTSRRALPTQSRSS